MSFVAFINELCCCPRSCTHKARWCDWSLSPFNSRLAIKVTIRSMWRWWWRWWPWPLSTSNTSWRRCNQRRPCWRHWTRSRLACSRLGTLWMVNTFLLFLNRLCKWLRDGRRWLWLRAITFDSLFFLLLPHKILYFKVFIETKLLPTFSVAGSLVAWRRVKCLDCAQ